MRKFRLKKDLPFAKAGDMVEMWSDGIMAFVGEPNLPRFNKKDVRMFPLWFEEVDKKKFGIDAVLAKVIEVSEELYTDSEIDNLNKLGAWFDTKEEAEKYLEYRKAKTIIKQDTKGFKPDWWDKKQIKYSGSYQDDPFTGYGCVKLAIKESSTTMESLVYFKSKKDIEESFKKHPEEWRKYLFYEQ